MWECAFLDHIHNGHFLMSSDLRQGHLAKTRHRSAVAPALSNSFIINLVGGKSHGAGKYDNITLPLSPFLFSLQTPYWHEHSSLTSTNPFLPISSFLPASNSVFPPRHTTSLSTMPNGATMERPGERCRCLFHIPRNTSRPYARGTRPQMSWFQATLGPLCQKSDL